MLELLKVGMLIQASIVRFVQLHEIRLQRYPEFIFMAPGRLGGTLLRSAGIRKEAIERLSSKT